MFRVLLIAVVLCFSALAEAQPVPPSAPVTAEAVKANPAPVPNVTLPPPTQITEPKKSASPVSQPLKPAEKVSTESGGKSPEQAGEANQKTAVPAAPSLPLSQPLKSAEKVSAESGAKSPEQAGEANQKTAVPSAPSLPLSQPLKSAEKVSTESGGKSPEQAGEANQKMAVPSAPPGDRASSSPVAPQPGTEPPQKGTSKPEAGAATPPPGQTEPQSGMEQIQEETPPPECAPEEAPSDATEAPSGQEETGKGPSPWLKILDVLVVRPFAVVGSTVSTAAYIAISPLAFVMGLGESAARLMVEAPWRFTAFRYVGQFNHYVDEEPIMGVWDF